MTADTLAAIRELAELRRKATQGPWYFEAERDGSLLPTRVGSEGHRRGIGDYAFIYGPSKPIASISSEVGQDQSFAAADATFIAAAGSLDFDALLALLDAEAARHREDGLDVETLARAMASVDYEADPTHRDLERARLYAAEYARLRAAEARQEKP